MLPFIIFGALAWTFSLSCRMSASSLCSSSRRLSNKMFRISCVFVKKCSDSLWCASQLFGSFGMMPTCNHIPSTPRCSVDPVARFLAWVLLALDMSFLELRSEVSFSDVAMRPAQDLFSFLVLTLMTPLRTSKLRQ